MTAFFDSNVLLYAQEANAKGARARALVADGGKISVQVLNEFASVSSRKFGRTWAEIDAGIGDVLAVVDPPVALTTELHNAARALAAAHQLAFYDALIVAAAMDQACDTLFSEDMQHGRKFAALTVVNPFA